MNFETIPADSRTANSFEICTVVTSLSLHEFRPTDEANPNIEFRATLPIKCGVVSPIEKIKLPLNNVMHCRLR